MAKHELVVALPDGRLLGYAEYGDPGGQPVVFFHGWRGSRLTPRWAFDTPLEAIRLVAVERPGYGLSDFEPGRTIAGFAADVARAADHLGIGDFAVVALDEGAAFALGCAARLAERVTAVALVSPLGPLDSDAGRAAHPGARSRRWRALRQAAPLLGVPLGFSALAARRFPALAMRQLAHDASPADRRALEDRAFRGPFLADLREATRHGIKGMVDEARLLFGPWGFPLDGVRCPVLLWHGEDDRMIPPSTAAYLCSQLRDCRPAFVGGAGHYWIRDGAAKVIDALQQIQR